MVITFLGTAAAEGVPAIFCNCPSCVRAKAESGHNIRTRSQILVDDKLLIDFPPDTYSHTITNNWDISAVKNVLITHSHKDHCYPQEFMLHGEPFARNMTNDILSVCANSTVIRMCRRQIRSKLRRNVKESLRFIKLKSYNKIVLDGAVVTPLPANHSKNESCFIYLIQSDGKTFLQFNDSGILDESVYEYLAQSNVHLDLVSYDCTYGYVRKGRYRHMGMLDNVDERARMEKRGIISPATLHVLTHFSHNAKMTHAEIDAKAKELGFIAAYDGMKIEI